MNAMRLGGWWRLWIVLSLVFGALVFAATFEPRPAKLDWTETIPADAKIDYEKWRDERLDGRKCTEEFVFPLRFGVRDNPSAPHTMTVWCTPTPDYLTPLGLALIPGALLLLLGLTFA